MSYSIGIDLGTSNCCVSIATDRECRVVPVNNGHEQLLPSKVDFTDPNNIRVGSIVSESLIKKGNAVEGNKRIIGHKFNEECIQEIKQYCQAEVVEGKDGYCYYYIPAQDRNVSPEDVNVELLKVLYNTAIESMGGQRPKGVWITVPASFNQKQRSITRRSAERVIKEPVHLLSEPAAAAIQYGYDNLYEEGTMVIYDLGGGTFDVCIVRIQNQTIDIVDTSGHPTIGGNLFDSLIMEYACKDYEQYMLNEMGDKGYLLPDSLKENDIAYQKSLYALLRACREAKHHLSNPACETKDINIDEYFDIVERIKHKYGIDIPDDDDDDGISYPYVCPLSRDKLNELISPYIQTTINITLKLLYDNNLNIQDISRVLLVGGSSFIPYIRTLLSETFGPEKIGYNINCNTCVSMGAALHNLKDNLIDRSTYDICILTNGNTYNVLIPKNSPLPCSGYKLLRSNRWSCWVNTSVYERSGEGENEYVKYDSILDNDRLLEEIQIRVDYTLTVEGELTVRFTDVDYNEVLKEDKRVLDL